MENSDLTLGLPIDETMQVFAPVIHMTMIDLWHISNNYRLRLTFKIKITSVSFAGDEKKLRLIHLHPLRWVIRTIDMCIVNVCRNLQRNENDDKSAAPKWHRKK